MGVCERVEAPHTCSPFPATSQAAVHRTKCRSLCRLSHLPGTFFSSMWIPFFLYEFQFVFPIQKSITSQSIPFPPIDPISPYLTNQFYFLTSSKQLYFLHPRDLNKFCLILAWHLRVCHYLKIEIFSPDVLVQVVGFCPFTMHFIL
jgi:hypothetical protein